MSDTKISALPAASTPLTGSEVVPLNQSGVTSNVTVANLTAGRNITFNNTLPGYTTTATAAGTTTLTSSSTYHQRFTGSSAQTIVLPNATTMAQGQGFIIDNDSLGSLSLQDGSLASLGSVTPGMAVYVFCEDNSTTAGSWSGYMFVPGGGPGGQVTWGTVGLAMGGQALSGVNTINMSGQLTSTLVTGTAPFVVASTTQVSNLNAATAGTATNATNVGTTDNTSSSSTYYSTLVSATSGNNPITTSSTKLSFVPSTGILTATGFSGSLNGTVGATTPAAGKFTTITASSTITPSTTSGIVGTTLADNAQAGSVGEYVISTVTAPGSGLTSTTATNITSISLTAGDWDVTGVVSFNYNSGAIPTTIVGVISTTSATLPNTHSGYTVYLQTTFATAGTLESPVPVTRINVSTTTTVYLVGLSVFAGGVAGIGGTIRARRIR